MDRKRDRVQVHSHPQASGLERSINRAIEAAQGVEPPAEVVSIQYQTIEEPSSFQGQPGTVVYTALLHLRGGYVPKSEES